MYDKGQEVGYVSHFPKSVWTKEGEFHTHLNDNQKYANGPSKFFVLPASEQSVKASLADFSTNSPPNWEAGGQQCVITVGKTIETGAAADPDNKLLKQVTGIVLDESKGIWGKMPKRMAEAMEKENVLSMTPEAYTQWEAENTTTSSQQAQDHGAVQELNLDQQIDN